MRKIFSILIALGLVLGLTVMATPVSAAVSGVSVSVAPNCAGAAAAYNVTFNISASLTQGVHSVCIEFPAGTTVPTTFVTGKIKIEGVSVFGTEVTVTGQKVCFLVPATFEPTPANPILVEFAADAGLKNPLTPGATYKVKVNTSRAPDSTPVESAAYTIAPAISAYGFEWDSNPTYPGIAVGFIPPFKACGQGGNTPGNVEFSTGKFQNAFNLTLAPTVVGCAAPCTANVTMNVTLTAAPAGSTVTLNLTGTPTWGNTLTPAASSYVISTLISLGTDTTIEWAGLIHFDTVGTYQICFDVICPAGALICPACSSAATSVVHQCYDFKVYQWKDAQKITLQEKWNLISLPLVPLVGASGNIADMLLSIPAADRAKILSIWNYDCTAKTFSTFGPGFTSLSTMVDGKAYWVRVTYPYSTTACGPISWWVFGTEKPMPPASPAQYPVCAGWNMVGFLGTSNMAHDAYLWNWAGTPVVYTWDSGCWNVQNWRLLGAIDPMTPGAGYWVAFTAAGAVYVP